MFDFGFMGGYMDKIEVKNRTKKFMSSRPACPGYALCAGRQVRNEEGT